MNLCHLTILCQCLVQINQDVGGNDKHQNVLESRLSEIGETAKDICSLPLPKLSSEHLQQVSEDPANPVLPEVWAVHCVSCQGRKP